MAWRGTFQTKLTRDGECNRGIGPDAQIAFAA
jgi:hypothetical protein